MQNNNVEYNNEIMSLEEYLIKRYKIKELEEKNQPQKEKSPAFKLAELFT